MGPHNWCNVVRNVIVGVRLSSEVTTGHRLLISDGYWQGWVYVYISCRSCTLHSRKPLNGSQTDSLATVRIPRTYAPAKRSSPCICWSPDACRSYIHMHHSFLISLEVFIWLSTCVGAQIALWVLLLLGACATTMVDPGMGMACSGACVHALLFSLSRSLSRVPSLSCAFCLSLSLLYVLSLSLSLSLMCSLSRSCALYHTRVRSLLLVHSLFLSCTLSRPSLSICKCWHTRHVLRRACSPTCSNFIAITHWWIMIRYSVFSIWGCWHSKDMLYNRLFCLLRWDSAGGHQHNDVCGYVPIRQKVWARLVGFWNCDACSRYDTLVHTCKSAHIHTCTRTHAGTHSHTQAQARTARTHTNIQYNPTLPSQTPPPFRHLSGRCRAICGSER